LSNLTGLVDTILHGPPAPDSLTTFRIGHPRRPGSTRVVVSLCDAKDAHLPLPLLAGTYHSLL
jgi:hypothetical protein